MAIKKLRDFIDELENRRLDKEFQGGKGTIWLKNFDEFKKLSESFKGQLVSPGGAAGYLGVSRAMIHQLERDGKIRAYRLIVTDEDWEGYPFHIKLLLSRKSLTIWIPVEDLESYAQTVRKRRKKSK